MIQRVKARDGVRFSMRKRMITVHYRKSGPVQRRPEVYEKGIGKRERGA
jgi:hypothetical protein